MALSNVPKMPRDGTVTLSDGSTPTAVELTLTYERGDFSFEKPLPEEVIFRDRGTIVGVGHGDEAPITFSFSVDFRQFTNATAGSIIDFIDFANAYSTNTSVGANGFGRAETNLVDLAFTVEGSDHGDDTDHTATFSTCQLSYSVSEDKPYVINVTGTCYEGVAYTGPT